MSILNVNNLSVEYVKALGSNKALKDVSINVNENEILGIVGESGCGKSTLARCILRLIEPTKGKVKFLGKMILQKKLLAKLMVCTHFQVLFFYIKEKGIKF